MEDKREKDLKELTSEEKLEREFKEFNRDKLSSRTRAAVVRSQIIRAYEILEGIRFDFVSDTAFRDKIVRAKKSLESAIDDFLMSDKYWEDKVDFFMKMSLEDYKKWKNRPTAQSKGKK